MVELDHRLFLSEFKNQIETRIEMAVEKKYQYDGSDPINSLPLTDFQRGLIAGRLETWEFFSIMVPEVFENIIKRYSNKED